MLVSWSPGWLVADVVSLSAKVNESAHLIIRSLANPDTTTATTTSERYAIPFHGRRKTAAWQQQHINSSISMSLEMEFIRTKGLESIGSCHYTEASLGECFKEDRPDK